MNLESFAENNEKKRLSSPPECKWWGMWLPSFWKPSWEPKKRDRMRIELTPEEKNWKLERGKPHSIQIIFGISSFMIQKTIPNLHMIFSSFFLNQFRWSFPLITTNNDLNDKIVVLSNLSSRLSGMPLTCH